MKLSKNINKILVTLFMSLSVFLAGCFGGSTGIGGGGNSGGGNGGGNNGGGGPVTEVPETPGNSADIHEMFDKFKILHSSDNIKVKDPINQNQEKTFTELLDRQITILSKDLLYRLTAVYGSGMTEVVEDTYGSKSYIIESSYAYNSEMAKVNSAYILDRPYTFNGNVPRFRDSFDYEIDRNEPKVNEVSSYADLIFRGSWYDSTVSPLVSNFIFEGAINDSYKWLETGIGVGYFIKTDEELLQWEWSEYSGNIEFYYDEYLDLFKTEIAKIVAPVNYKESELSYNELLSKIEYLGFTTEDYNEIIDLILNKVIGMENIELDNYIYNNILTPVLGVNNYILPFYNENDEDVVEIYNSLYYLSENSGLYFPWLMETDEYGIVTADNHKNLWHYFKAYNIMVPAMVERALSNSFGFGEIDRRVMNSSELPVKDENGKVVKYEIGDIENITIQNDVAFYSLYPKMTKTAQSDIMFKEDVDDIYMYGQYKIQSIVLQPKAIGGVAVTTLMLYFSPYGTLMSIPSTGNEENPSDIKYVDSIEIKFQINVKYVANGVVFLDEIVSSEVNNDSSIFHLDGPMQVLDYPGLPITYLPHDYDLNILGHMKKNSDGKYVSVDGTVTSDEYPVFDVYNGTDITDFDLWNNPYKFSGYDFGDNYIELSFNIIELTRNGEPYEGEVVFDLGFGDPIT